MGFTRSLARELGPTGITVNAMRRRSRHRHPFGRHHPELEAAIVAAPAGPAGQRRRRHLAVRFPRLRGGRLHHRDHPEPQRRLLHRLTADPTPIPTKETAMTQTVDRGTRVADLAAAADRIRHHILDMGEVQGQGYVGQGLGFADVLAVIYKDLATYQPKTRNGTAGTGCCCPWATTPSPSTRRWPRPASCGRRTGHLRIGRLPAADVRDEHLHPRHGNLRRLPGPRPRRRRRDGPRPAVPGQPRPGHQHDERRRTRRGLHLGSRDGRRPPRPGQPAVRGRHERTAGRRRDRRGTAHRTRRDKWAAFGWRPSASTATTSTPCRGLRLRPSRRQPAVVICDTQIGRVCRSWKPGKRRTSSASTKTNGTSPARRSAPPTPRSN